jgi:hypothetical protein
MDESSSGRGRTPKIALAVLPIPFVVALVLFLVDRL